MYNKTTHNGIDLPEESMGSYSYFPEAFTSISTGHLEFHNIFVVTLREKNERKSHAPWCFKLNYFGINQVMLKTFFARVIYKWATFECFHGHESIK